MVDTFTPFGKIRLPQTGAYEDQWGAVLNSDAFTLLDDMITGESAISLTTTAYSLPAMTNGADSDARSFCLRFDGTPGGAVTVTVPATATRKFYLVDNRCGQQITMTYGSGGTAVIPNGEKRLVWCDGTACYTPSASASDATTVGGITPALFARRDQSNAFTGGRNSSPWITVVEGPVTTIDSSLGNHQRLTLTGNRAMAAPTNTVDGLPIVLQIRQDASGGRTLTWSSEFVFETGLPPTLAAGAFGIDLFLMFYDAANNQWLVGHFASIASSTGASLNMTIEGNQQDVSLAALLGSVATPIVLNITIAQGAILSAGSTGSYGFDCDGALPVGSTLNLVNLGYVIGRGGDGAEGASMAGDGLGFSAGNARAGGGALRAPGSGVTFNLTNGSGFIWGGGGGGGGGAAGSSNGSDRFGKGGGGGGGAGGGRGGPGAYRTNGNEYGAANRAGDGADGSTGIDGSAGVAGGGATRGDAVGGSGGAGGGYGAAGSVGNAAALFHNADAGAGGAAGKAIELNGGSASFVSGNGSPNILGAVS